MRVIISGATGLIGRRLLKTLAAGGHTLDAFSRHAGANMPSGVRVFVWDPVKGEPPADSLRDADAVVHLSGEPIAQRWTADAKQRIGDSRIIGTRNLVSAMAKQARRPQVLVCGSAVGYYGDRGDEILTEASAPGNGFLPDLVVQWEKEAQNAQRLGVRVVHLRTGVALDPRGGALARMLTPFKLGAGGRLAGGKQWMSWIHLEDLTGMIRFALENPVTGAMNGTAPNPVINAEFTRILAQALKRPAVFPMPAVALKILFGEMSEILLSSQRALPRLAESAGFQFRFPQLAPALADLLK